MKPVAAGIRILSKLKAHSPDGPLEDYYTPFHGCNLTSCEWLGKTNTYLSLLLPDFIDKTSARNSSKYPSL